MLRQHNKKVDNIDRNISITACYTTNFKNRSIVKKW